jgi:hypothetical protein
MTDEGIFKFSTFISKVKVTFYEAGFSGCIPAVTVMLKVLKQAGLKHFQSRYNDIMVSP